MRHTLANPADVISEISIQEEPPKDQEGVRKISELIDELAHSTLIDAKVNRSLGDPHQGDILVDLYEAGVPIDDQTDPQPTRKNIPAYFIMQEDHQFDFDDGAWIKVRMTGIGFAIVPPQPLPRGQGIGRILTLLDDRKPSVAVWDHPRFW